VERAYAYFLGDGTRGWPLEETGMRLLDELLSPTLAMHRLVRGRIADDQAELLLASREQELVLNRARSRRRVEVVGPAGSGKSMLAAEKARRLAREGYRTLLVCFNQRLATTVMRDLADTPAPGGLEVTTFHRLCERLGTAAGVLPTRPTPIPPAWWDETLPAALEAAIDALPTERFHAIVIDEGQDFARGWIETLDFLLRSPGEDTLWVFHDRLAPRWRCRPKERLVRPKAPQRPPDPTRSGPHRRADRQRGRGRLRRRGTGRRWTWRVLLRSRTPGRHRGRTPWGSETPIPITRRGRGIRG
jgi:hypothetical protein